MSPLPDTIDPSETLGRGVFDSRKAEHAQRGVIPPAVFREKSGVRELSADHLSFGNHEKISSVHDTERSGQRFHGWATLSAEDASRFGRTVVANPILPQNLYHAEIILPDMSGLDADEEQDQHALNLAMLATWLPRPANLTANNGEEGPSK